MQAIHSDLINSYCSWSNNTNLCSLGIVVGVVIFHEGNKLHVHMLVKILWAPIMPEKGRRPIEDLELYRLKFFDSTEEYLKVYEANKQHLA